MFKSLYCHIGSGKTGTSSIQGSFFQNPDILRQHGVYTIRRPGVTVLPAMVDDPQKLFPVRSRNLGANALEKAHRQIKTGLAKAIRGGEFDTGVLSTEHCLGLSKPAVEKLKLFLDEYSSQVRIVYYARHPYSKIPSTFNQWIKTGQASLDRPISNYLRGFEQELSNWIDVFGKDNIIVRKFEVGDMTDHSPVADFCETIGKPDLYGDLEVVRSNEAISAPAALIADELNRYLSATKQQRAPYDFLTEIAGSKFTLPKERVLEIDELIQQQLHFLRDTFGVDLKTPDFPEHDQSVATLFTPDVLLSIGKVMNNQALEIKALKAKLKKLA